MTNLPSHSPSSSYHHLFATKFHPPLNSLAEGITGRTLLPPKADPYARSLVRLQADHISRGLVPAFYRFLQAQDLDAQVAGALEFSGALERLTSLLERGEHENVAKGGPASGLWYEDGS
jgi:glutathione S-transferase